MDLNKLNENMNFISAALADIRPNIMPGMGAAIEEPKIEMPPPQEDGVKAGDLLQSRMNKAFNALADDLHGLGMVDGPDRVSLGVCMAAALDMFQKEMESKCSIAKDKIVPRLMAKELMEK